MKLLLELSGFPCSMRVNPWGFVGLGAIFRLTTRLANLHLVDFIGETTAYALSKRSDNADGARAMRVKIIA